MKPPFREAGWFFGSREEILNDYPYRGSSMLIGLDPLMMMIPDCLLVTNKDSKKLMIKEGRLWCKEHGVSYKTELKSCMVYRWVGHRADTIDKTIIRPSTTKLPIINFDDDASMIMFKFKYG